MRNIFLNGLCEILLTMNCLASRSVWVLGWWDLFLSAISRIDYRKILLVNLIGNNSYEMGCKNKHTFQPSELNIYYLELTKCKILDILDTIKKKHIFEKQWYIFLALRAIKCSSFSPSHSAICRSYDGLS